jgi:hypothetical protein
VEIWHYIGLALAAVGVFGLVTNGRRPRDWVSPIASWITRDRQVVIDALLAIGGFLIFGAAQAGVIA